jgi:hypothetical protein
MFHTNAFACMGIGPAGNVTDNDNGFVTMFFLLVPALSSLISLPLSWWIPDLRFAAGPMFFGGLALVAASLFIFSSRSW